MALSVASDTPRQGGSLSAILDHSPGGTLAKGASGQHSHTQSVTAGDDGAMKKIPRPPPLPEKMTCVSPSQPTPWRPASFLPGALPTACGGTPGNLPASTDPQASWMRTRTDSQACLDSLEGCPVFEGLESCIKVRNGIPRWLLKTHTG